MKYPICVPSKNRPNSDFISKCEEEQTPIFIFVDDTETMIDDYKKLQYATIVQCKNKNIAYVRYNIIEEMKNKGHNWVWILDDDTNKLITRDENFKDKKLTVKEFFETAEKYIDQDTPYIKFLTTGLMGMQFNKKTGRPEKEYKQSKTSQVANVYGLNIDIMKKYNIQFDKNVPHGCGEDLDLTAQFIHHKLYGKCMSVLGWDHNQKIESQAWPFKTANGTKNRNPNELQPMKDVFVYLKHKWPNIIKWSDTMGSTCGPKSVPYPEWWTEGDLTQKMTFGKVLI